MIAYGVVETLAQGQFQTVCLSVSTGMDFVNVMDSKGVLTVVVMF